MFGAGVPWGESLTMPLADSLSIMEAHLDDLSVSAHRHAERVWASIAPHVANAMPPPEPPQFD